MYIMYIVYSIHNVLKVCRKHLERNHFNIARSHWKCWCVNIQCEKQKLYVVFFILFSFGENSHLKNVYRIKQSFAIKQIKNAKSIYITFNFSHFFFTCFLLSFFCCYYCFWTVFFSFCSLTEKKIINMARKR